ncbi:hypothetical protein CEP51_012651 [Fusarium floridanum]|uniref:Mitochondrial intermembrane space import and assembly protein 40 n=1 Tax=Fusarium floridanum TaxID=1325733 RepID=A0A428QQ52_9HYPO|nr:hypothetical protein CEP51_012651 [Fusarium floridanum]
MQSCFGRLAGYQRLEDQERQQDPERGCLGTWPPNRPRFTKPGWTTTCLILVDLALFGLLLYSLRDLFSLLRHNKEMFSPHVNVTLQDQEPVHSSRQIPRILHQTCKNETIPEMWAESQQSCLKAYSGFEYKLWTDERAREFLSSEYPWFLETWDTYPFPIQRADAIRYFVLHHYGGIYLDMDTVCHKPFPIDQIETDRKHNSLFQATKPTGITNDIMISSVRHPAFASAISRLPIHHRITRFWAWLLPYAAIMFSTGPLFISLATAAYLYTEPSLPSPTVQVISSTNLKPYITDLQTSTWYRADARVLKWLANKPLIWFVLGIVGVVGGVYLLNKVLLLIYRVLCYMLKTMVANLRSIASPRFTSTATQQRPTRSWKSSAVRLSLAAGIFYYFNTGPVFAEAASQTVPTPTNDLPAKDGATQKQKHVQAKPKTIHEKNPGSTKSAEPQSGAQNDMTANDTSTSEDTSQQGAYNPETGEFNWDCSCLGGMAHGPCGEEFKSAFSCFMLSTDDPKGMNCIDQFKIMQECFKKYPEVYGAELADDAEDDPTSSAGDEQPDTSGMQANSTPPTKTDTTSEEPKRARKNEGSKKRTNGERI